MWHAVLGVAAAAWAPWAGAQRTAADSRPVIAQAADPATGPIADPAVAPVPATADGGSPDRPRLPLWELGFGVAGLSLPNYRGADQRSGYLLPLPYLIYRGTFLRSDRDGARAVFVDTERVEVDLSVSGSAPAKSDASGARAGMADLPASFELGPNLNLTLWRERAGPRAEVAHLDVRLPVRAAITVQRSPRSIGWVFAPNLNLDLPGAVDRWNLGLAAGPQWGSRAYHQHYYGVNAADAVSTATLQRPAYQARGGYAGWYALVAMSRRFERAWVGGYVRYDRLAGAVFDDSPLVRRRQGVSAGIGVAWVFANSATLVDVPPHDAGVAR